MLSGPVGELAGHIPDFGIELYDLHRYSDNEIKGPIMHRVVLMLFKHIFDTDLRHRLTGIFALIRSLMEKDTGLQYLEVVVRYLSSVLDEEDLSLKETKEIAEQVVSKDTGGYVMTLAEKLRNEGEQRGEKKGEIKGLKEGIELGITLKFPGDIGTVMAEVGKIDDLGTLKEIIKAIHTANDISEILALLK